MRCTDFGIIKRHGKIKRLREMLIHYSVQLCRNFREIPVQIKRFHTDLIATHPIAVIRLYCFVRCGIQKHTGHPMRFISKLGVFVFHISENLIQIAGMERVDVVLSLRSVSIVLGVNDENFVAPSQHNIALHDWEHSSDTIV